MITSKQRAKLRGIANDIDTIFQIGKGGIGDNFIKQMDDALEAREIVKVKVLETAFISAREACEEVCAAVGAEPVATIGNKFVVYRESKNDKKIEL
ncbi:MAG: ribosome assembly RNA-binding protein YhbY [Clostridia bacterium]|nr:ribosome assembly RNA-binding protein YhbY [Clostridia bacterium]